MRVKVRKHEAGGWLVTRDNEHNGGVCVSYRGPFWQAVRFLFTGRHTKPLPRFVFRIDNWNTFTFQGERIQCGSAGLYAKYLYVEVFQGVDWETRLFYRWLRVGVPRVGALKFCLAKLSVAYL